MTQELDEYDKNVLRGIVFLDEHIPDWRTNVRKNDLRMEDSCSCIVGQWLAPFGLSYYDLADWLYDADGIGESATQWLYKHGFVRHVSQSDEEYATAYAPLDLAWRRWI